MAAEGADDFSFIGFSALRDDDSDDGGGFPFNTDENFGCNSSANLPSNMNGGQDSEERVTTPKINGDDHSSADSNSSSDNMQDQKSLLDLKNSDVAKGSSNENSDSLTDNIKVEQNETSKPNGEIPITNNNEVQNEPPHDLKEQTEDSEDEPLATAVSKKSDINETPDKAEQETSTPDSPSNLVGKAEKDLGIKFQQCKIVLGGAKKGPESLDENSSSTKDDEINSTQEEKVGQEPKEVEKRTGPMIKVTKSKLKPLAPKPEENAAEEKTKDKEEAKSKWGNSLDYTVNWIMEEKNGNGDKDNQLTSTHQFLLSVGKSVVCERFMQDVFDMESRQARRNPNHDNSHLELLQDTLKVATEKNAAYKLDVIKCRSCSFKTDSRFVADDHKQKVHYNFRQNMICCLCDNFEPTKNLSLLIEHMDVAHNQKVKLDPPPIPFECPTCAYEATQRSQLTRHKNSCQRNFRENFNLAAPPQFTPALAIPLDGLLNGPRTAAQLSKLTAPTGTRMAPPTVTSQKVAPKPHAAGLWRFSQAQSAGGQQQQQQPNGLLKQQNQKAQMMLVGGKLVPILKGAPMPGVRQPARSPPKPPTLPSRIQPTRNNQQVAWNSQQGGSQSPRPPFSHGGQSFMQSARPQMQNARPQMQNARPQMQNTRPQMQNARPQMQNARLQMQNARPQMLPRLASPATRSTSLLQARLPNSRHSNLQRNNAQQQSNMMAGGMPSAGKSQVQLKTYQGYVQCEICEGYVKSWEALRLHLQFIHKVVLPDTAIDKRNNTMTTTQGFRCFQCDAAFFTKQGLITHKNKCLGQPAKAKENVQIIQCCWVCKTNTSQLQKHIRAAHKNTKIFPCYLCNCCFPSQPMCMTHMKNLHKPNHQQQQANLQNQSPRMPPRIQQNISAVPVALVANSKGGGRLPSAAAIAVARQNQGVGGAKKGQMKMLSCSICPDTVFTTVQGINRHMVRRHVKRSSIGVARVSEDEIQRLCARKCESDDEDENIEMDDIKFSLQEDVQCTVKDMVARISGLKSRRSGPPLAKRSKLETTPKRTARKTTGPSGRYRVTRQMQRADVNLEIDYNSPPSSASPVEILDSFVTSPKRKNPRKSSAVMQGFESIHNVQEDSVNAVNGWLADEPSNNFDVIMSKKIAIAVDDDEVLPQEAELFSDDDLLDDLDIPGL